MEKKKLTKAQEEARAKTRERLREIDNRKPRLYQKRLPTSMCPRCAADVTVKDSRYVCACGAEWSEMFNVFLPKPSALIRRTVSDPNFKKNFMRDVPVVAARLAAVAQDARTVGMTEVVRRAKSGYYTTLIPKRQEGDSNARNQAGSGDGRVHSGAEETEEGSPAVGL